MLSLSITFPPDCAERTNLLSQTSLKTLIELSKKCRWPLVISVLDPPDRSRRCFPSLTPLKLLGYPQRSSLSANNGRSRWKISAHCGRTLQPGKGRTDLDRLAGSRKSVSFPVL